MSDDEEEGAIDAGMEPESPTGADPVADDSHVEDDESFEGSSFVPGETTIHRTTNRPISEKTRELFKKAAAEIAKQKAEDPDEDDGEIAYDEAPKKVTPAPAAAVSPSGASPVGPSAVAAAPAPSLDPQVMQMREQLAADRETFAKEREAWTEKAKSSDLVALRDMWNERPTDVIKDLVKRWDGIESDDHLREAIADLMTDLGIHVLGVDAGPEVKNRIEAKRALKSVKAYKASLTESQKADEARREQSRQADERSRAIGLLGREMGKPDVAQQFPFLSAEDNASELIFDVVEAQLKRDGTMLQWMDAAKRANDYLKKQASAYYDKRKHLFNAAPAQAGGEANGKKMSVQGDPQGIRRSHAPQAANAAPAAPLPESNGKWSNEAHRARTKARMRAAFTRADSDD